MPETTTGGSGKIPELLHALHAGPVFGPDEAFGSIGGEDDIITLERGTKIIAFEAIKPLQDVIQIATPDLAREQREAELMYSLGKTATFFAALGARDLDTRTGHQVLKATIMSGFGMYFGDQRADQWDEFMIQAIESEGMPAGLRAEASHPWVESRRNLFPFMRDSLERVSLEDASELYTCFMGNVLVNEAAVTRHSQRYFVRDTDGRQRYMDDHAGDIAKLAVKDAGFQAVVGVLHAAERSAEITGGLPLVSQIHGDMQMRRNIEVWNAVARVADEFGDWKTDQGNDPSKGAFSINPFNVPHPAFVEKFCRLAGIENHDQLALLQDRFEHFHDSPDGRQATGRLITDIFFDQLRSNFRSMSPGFAEQYKVYLKYAKRVAEVAHVNMAGDEEMAG